MSDFQFSSTKDHPDEPLTSVETAIVIGIGVMVVVLDTLGDFITDKLFDLVEGEDNQ